MKNVYLVTVDTCTGYGCSIQLVGIFESLDMANKAVENIMNSTKIKRGCFLVKEIPVNNTYSLTEDYADYADYATVKLYNGDTDEVVSIGSYIE